MFAPLVMGQNRGPASFDRTDMTFDMTDLTFDQTTYRGSINYEVKIIGGRPHLVYTVGSVTYIEQLSHSGPTQVFSISGETVIYRGRASYADVVNANVVVCEF